MIQRLLEIFTGHSWRRSSEEWQKTSDQWKELYLKNKEKGDELYEMNFRLITALREMDQGTFQISQVAPDWTRIQPIFKKMFEATEKRMATENNRIRNLVVGEIVTAYNGPPVDFRTLSKTKVLKIEDKS